MKVLLTGSKTDQGRLMTRALIQQDHAIHDYLGDVQDREHVHRAMRFVHVVVHCDFLDEMAAASLEQLVEHNLHGALVVAGSALELELPFYYCMPTDAYGKHAKSLAMARVVLDKDYAGFEIYDPTDGL